MNQNYKNMFWNKKNNNKNAKYFDIVKFGEKLQENGFIFEDFKDKENIKKIFIKTCKDLDLEIDAKDIKIIPSLYERVLNKIKFLLTKIKNIF